MFCIEELLYLHQKKKEEINIIFELKCMCCDSIIKRIDMFLIYIIINIIILIC